MAARTSTAVSGPSNSAQSKLFDSLRYFVASSITLGDRPGLKELLNRHGAIESSDISSAELVLTETEEFEGVENMAANAHKVLPQWVQRSIENKTRQGPEYFSPDPRAIFSTLVICSDHLPPGDLEAVIAATRAKGGIYRDGLARDVTHLLVLAPAGDKYHTARKFANSTRIKIVMVNWFDDCLKTQRRVPERLYEQAISEAAREYEGRLPPTNEEQMKARQLDLTTKARHFYAALERASTPPAEDQASPSKKKKEIPLPQHRVWEGRRIMLSHSLTLSTERRQVVELEIGRAGGVVVRPSESASTPSRPSLFMETPEELEESIRFDLAFASGGEVKRDARISRLYREKDRYEALKVLDGDIDVLITKYRSGLQYIAALRSNQANKSGRKTSIMIGTLAWLFYVQSTGTISYPTEQLLHFPIRRGAVEDIRGKQVTITNYKGPTRDYLKKLINAMAGPRDSGPEAFSASLTKNISLVIAGKLEGDKIQHAQNWKIPIVSHMWLEDTFRDWKWCSLTDTKYHHWTPNMSYNDLLPGCRIADNPAQHLQSELEIVLREMHGIGYEKGEMDAVFGLDVHNLKKLLAIPLTVTSTHAFVDLGLTEEAMEEVTENGPEEGPGGEIVPVSSSPIKASSAAKRGPQNTSFKSSRTTQEGNGGVESRNEWPASSSSNKPLPASANASPLKTGAAGLAPSAVSAATTKKQSANLANVNVPTPLLRSPFDPSPSKKPGSGVVVNDTPLPTKKETKTKNKRTGRDVVAVSAENAGGGARRKSNMFKPKSKQPKPLEASSSSEADERAAEEDRDQRSEEEEDPVPVPSSRGTSPDDQPPEREYDVDDGGGDGMDVDEKPLLQEEKKKGKMRVMRTQESDDEAFQIESQKDLLARRKKVLESGGAKVKASGMEIKSEKSSRKEARETSGSEDSEDGDEAAYRDEKAASRHGKTQHKSSAALRRLRDSISGKEDSPGRKTVGSTQKPQLENRKSPGKNREKESSDEEVEEKDDDEDTYEEKNGSSSAQDYRSRTGSTNGDTEEGRSRGKRGAATEAAQRLHTIMPDANLFEEQCRKGKIRGDWEGDEKERASTSLKGKRRRESRGSDGEEQNDGEGRKKRRSVLGDTARRNRERSSSVVDAGVRFMTTKVDLTPQQIQGLRKIGFRKVEEPQSCTHLVSNSILRTEKFLCALSYGPKAVKSSWLIDCLAQKKVLDTKDYFLYDAIGERTYGVNLDHTLRRARERPGKLFEGHTFYLSPNMEKLHSTTLTNAIKAAGGMLHTIFPGVRSHYHSSEDQRLYQDLDSHLESKHFVSQKGDKDEDRWEELTSRGVPVYSPDFVLSAILRQQIGDLMDPKVMLARPT